MVMVYLKFDEILTLTSLQVYVQPQGAQNHNSILEAKL